MMSINQKGIVGENMAREFLKGKGYQIFEIDWIAEKDGECMQIEVKHKEAFEAPPFRGMGLEIWKVNRRLDFERKYHIRAYLLCFEPNDKKIYGQFLKNLEENGSFDTKRGIRIYPLASFKILGEIA